MKSNVKEIIQSILSLNGLSIGKAANKESIVSLIQKLHPFQTDKELIRFGAKGDGGYLIPNDLEGIKTCFSPGVGEFSSFEEDCVKHGMEVFLADKSVEAPAIKNEHFHFIKKFIGSITNDDFITMSDWIHSSIEDNDSDLLLQMDIEGHEYLSIINTPDSILKRFRILVIEFHYLEKLWNKEFFNLAAESFNKILTNHTCIHIHPNNLCGISRIRGVEIPKAAEFTFIRNDRFKNMGPQTNFPHPLDFDNISKNAVILPECWFSNLSK